MKKVTSDSGIVNNDFGDVVFKRRSVRALDPNHKISREEILQMIASATTAPSAIDTQPWKFLVVDTDEAKAKLDKVMHMPVDRGRVIASSFSVVIFADTQWVEDFDEIMQANAKVSPSFYTPEIVSFLNARSVEWYEELIAAGELISSISFQCGLVAMQFINVVRAHGYECGAMDDWDKWDISDHFDIDLKRYTPLICIAVGKPTGGSDDTMRHEPEEVVVFG